MPSEINKVAVIGTGVIGTGWIIRMLAHNKKVTAFDLNIKQKAILFKEIKRSLPFVKKLFKKKMINTKNLSFKTSLMESLKDVEEKIDYYLNNPELVKRKQELAYEFIKKCGTNHFSIEKMANSYLKSWVF